MPDDSAGRQSDESHGTDSRGDTWSPGAGDLSSLSTTGLQGEGGRR